MAEISQMETVVLPTAGMEENQAERTSEEVGEVEAIVGADELSKSAKKQGVNWDKQSFKCDEVDCQEVFETNEALEKHIRDIHFEGFDFVEYKDPLTVDTDVHFKRNYDRRISEISLVRFTSRSDSSKSGISGLMNRLEGSDTDTPDDFEKIAMEDTVEEDQEPMEEFTPTEISNDLAEKVQFSINHSVIGVVKAINGNSVEDYCDFVERNYPVDEADWPGLKAEVIETAKKGPKIFIKCSRGRITGYKKKDNIKIVAFIKLQNETETKYRVIEGGVKDYTDTDVDFTLDDHLMVPAFDNCVIRVEVRKLRTKDMNGRLLVGYTEIPLRDIPSTTIESYYELQKDGLEGLRRISMPSSDDVGHLVINLSRDDSEIDPNTAVPDILKKYFLEKSKVIFGIITSSQKDHSETISLNLSANQNRSPAQDGIQAYYQKLLTEDGNYPKSENNTATYSIDCVMSNKLELGVETRRRSVSPGKHLSAPNSHRRASSLSPSQSMISLLSQNRRESVGSNSSLISIGSTPKKKSSLNLMDKLNKTIGSIGDDLHDTFSPTSKPLFKIIPVDKIVPTLHLHKYTNHTIEGKEDISWESKVEMSSNVKVNSQDLNILYENAIIESIKASENNSWDGSFSKTVSSLLNMISCIVDAKRKDVNQRIADAFLKAHNISYFSDSLLKKHIETILKSETCSETLKRYVRKCLSKIIESHKCEEKLSNIAAIVQNLKLISQQDEEVSNDIKLCVEKISTNKFNSWKKDITKKIVDKSPTSTKHSVEVCRDILNLHILPETRKVDKFWQGMFEDILDYQQVTGNKYIELAREIVKKNLPKNEKKIILKYVDNSPRVKSLLLVYESFCAFKRIFNNLNPMQKMPDWLFDTYEQYPDLWMQLAIYKAEAQVENLLRHLRENEERFHKAETEAHHHGGTLSTEYNVDDITNETLVNFLGIAETCWTFRRELNWPSLEVNLRTGVKLIEDFAMFETRILNLFESIHMKDEDYDVVELSRTIKLLDGLLKRHHTTAEEVSSLHVKIADDDEMNEEERESFKLKMTGCYEAIEKVKAKSRDEIINKIKMYCEGRRTKIKTHILNKKLINEESCLMNCIDGELHLMYKNIQKKYHSDVMTALWKVMEEELDLQFQDRKQRNLSKNKPSRFDHFKKALPVIIDVKKGMHEDGVIPDLSLDILYQMQKEVIILTESSQILISKVLRLKAQSQKIDLDENGNNAQTKSTTMTLKLAYVTKSDNVMVEVINVQNIIPREKKTYSNIQLYVRFSPDRMGTGQMVEQTQVFKEVDRSIVFELQGDPIQFEFKMDHLSSKKHFEDGFLIFNLFHVNKVGAKLSIGECVSQVKMNGLLVTELVQISSESQFTSPDHVPGLSYQLQDFQSVYQSEVYLELHKRTDEAARAVVSKDDRQRKKSFFTKFT